METFAMIQRWACAAACLLVFVLPPAACCGGPGVEAPPSLRAYARAHRA